MIGQMQRKMNEIDVGSSNAALLQSDESDILLTWEVDIYVKLAF